MFLQLSAKGLHCDTDEAILKLQYRVLKSLGHSNSSIFQYFKEQIKKWIKWKGNVKYAVSMSGLKLWYREE
jgi:hypothetical protein